MHLLCRHVVMHYWTATAKTIFNNLALLPLRISLLLVGISVNTIERKRKPEADPDAYLGGAGQKREPGPFAIIFLRISGAGRTSLAFVLDSTSWIRCPSHLMNEDRLPEQQGRTTQGARACLRKAAGYIE